jgi:3-deoxy-manno-octulosonate cytidylyltransferase (CMP-KDO synthetase)
MPASAPPLILIPARMAAQRLPGKPLADIGGLPMIVRVLRQAEAAAAGPVAVAAGDPEIVDAVERAGGRAVLTDPALPSGTDRVRAAADLLDPERRHPTVINLQGDMPFVPPEMVALCAAVLDHPECDIATVVAPEGSPAERTDPAVVKAILAAEDAAPAAPSTSPAPPSTARARSGITWASTATGGMCWTASWRPRRRSSSGGRSWSSSARWRWGW